jgi:hypothetical protein
MQFHLGARCATVQLRLLGFGLTNLLRHTGEAIVPVRCCSAARDLH